MTIIKSNWKNYKIKDISIAVSAGATPSTKIPEYWENGTIPWMSSGEVNNEIINTTDKLITQLGFDNSSTKIIPKNSVLIALAGQGKTRGKVAINKIELCTNQSLASIIPNDKVHYKYLYYNLQYRYLELRELSSGDGGRGGLNLRLINNIKISLPPVNEQEKIAEILLTWDETIRSLSNMIMEERKKKKSIVSRIYRGHISKKTKETIKYSRLKNNLTEVTLRNNEDKGLVLSVSNTKGFIPQSEQFDREVASKNRSNYKIIKKTQFAYNPSRINVGSIDMLTSFESGILSPMYVVFETKDNLNSRYLYHFLKSDLFLQIIPRYTQGSVRDSLSFKGLSSMKIYLPELEEQNLYAEALDTIDYYIEKLEKLKELYKAQKQGLMQQLLTGKIRVNLN